MKRTRQVFHYNEDQVPTDISGCRMFHGEDLRKLLYPLSPKSSSFEMLKGRCYPLPIFKQDYILKYWCDITVNGDICVAFQDRMKMQAETQKQWVHEQKYEKQLNN